MKTKQLYLALAAATFSAAYGGSIDFELGGPCTFIEATALSSAYSGQGVTFSSVGANRGGAVLNKCGVFGLNARSGTDFLALNVDANLLNGNIPSGPELILFAAPVSNVSLYVGGTSAGPSYTLSAFDETATLLGTIAGKPQAGQWLQLAYTGANVKSVTLRFTGAYAVADDLTWNTPVRTDTDTPEPAGIALTGIGLAMLAARSRYLQAR